MKHLHVDAMFARRLSSHLKMFKRKDDYKWEFRCPICGDSKKSKTKCRGAILHRGSGLYFKCLNCNAGMSLGKFIGIISPSLYDEYIGTIFKNKSGIAVYDNEIEEQEYQEPVEFENIGLDLIEDLEDGHVAKEYIKNRLIPREWWTRIYFSENFGTWVSNYTHKYMLTKALNVPAIVLPIMDKDYKLLGAQARLLDSSNGMRYITTRFVEHEQLIFGLPWWKPNRKTYICEGPFDSTFLPNALACINSSLTQAMNVLSRKYDFRLSACVFVWDNEPKNKEICKAMYNAIRYAGDNVCIWPSNIIWKDINDMTKAGLNVKKIVDENTFSGLEALARFSEWRK